MYLLNQYAHIFIERIIEQYLDNRSKNVKPELGDQSAVVRRKMEDFDSLQIYKKELSILWT